MVDAQVSKTCGALNLMRVRLPPSAQKMELQQLKRKLKIAEEKLLKAGKRMGEAGGSGEWHDNSAWDNAVIDFKVREEIVNSLKESIRKLKNR